MASNKQKQLLLALESGIKLHQALLEPGMPSKVLLQEWLDNPEFDRLYTEATEAGRALRLARGGKPEPDAERPAPRPMLESAADTTQPSEHASQPHVPAVLRGNVSPATAEKGRELSQKLTEIIGDGDTYQREPQADAAPASPSTPSAPPAGRLTTAQKQKEVLRQLAEGVPAMEVKVTGYSGVVLALWRKDTNFLLRYDAAKKKGREARAQKEATATPAGAPEESAVAPPEAEPAPNQSEPTPIVADVPTAGTIEREINIPVQTDEQGQVHFGADPADADRKYQVVKAVNEAGWYTLEEAKAKAKRLAKKNNETTWVVERICTVELVPQILY